MDQHEEASGGRWRLASVLVLGAIGMLAAVDLALDLRQGTSILHAASEGGVVVLALAAAIALGRLLLNEARVARSRAAELRSRAAELDSSLQATREQAERWRAQAQNLLVGLGEAINDQFQCWQLTPAERETALLLLKGLSHKEIARARNVSEATARQQAAAIYRKAGLTGRHDLAAFFLEDLALPAAPAPAE